MTRILSKREQGGESISDKIEMCVLHLLTFILPGHAMGHWAHQWSTQRTIQVEQKWGPT